MTIDPQGLGIVKRRLKRLAIAVALVFGGCHLLTGPPFYYAGPIRATVIDEESGRPLPGAVVVALWQLDNWTGSDSGPLWGKEAVTDSKGEFYLPKSWPRLRPPFTFLRYRDPDIWIYSPGYTLAQLDNTDAAPFGYAGPFPYPWPAKRRCFWDGKTIPMVPVKTESNEAEWLREIEEIALVGRREHLDPKHYPRLWQAMLIGYSRLRDPSCSGCFGTLVDPAEAMAAWNQETVQ